MFVYTAGDLVILAERYMAHTGFAAQRLGLMIAEHQHLIENLLKGKDCVTATARQASDFFDLNWPPVLDWPKAVRRRPVQLLWRRQARGTQPGNAALASRARRPRTRAPAKQPVSTKRKRNGNGARQLEGSMTS
jgi:hypothetical protein